MALTLECDRVTGPESRLGSNDAESGLVEGRIAFQPRIQITSGNQPPIGQLPFQAQRVHALHMAKGLTCSDQGVGAGAESDGGRIVPARLRLVNLDTRNLFQAPLEEFVSQIELGNVNLLVDGF